MNGIKAVSSTQALPRHMKGSAYRCFLPDLTGFTGFHCVGPKYQHHLLRPASQTRSLRQEFNPAKADCRLQGTAISPSSTANPKDKFIKFSGGERGIRTPDTVPRIPAFQASSLSHSDISPYANILLTKAFCRHLKIFFVSDF